MASDIRITGWADLAVTIPYQLGFRPTDSLVVAALSEVRPACDRQQAHLQFLARLDLPPSGVEEAWKHQVAGLVRRPGVGAVSLVIYQDGSGADPLPWLGELLEDCSAQAPPVLAVVWVRGHHCSLDMGLTWAPLPGPERVSAVADFISAGAVALPDRRHLERLVSADPRHRAEVTATLASMARSFDPLSDPDRRTVQDVWWAVMSGGLPGGQCEQTSPPADLVARDARASAVLALGLADPSLRDALLGATCPALFGVLEAGPGAAPMPPRDGADTNAADERPSVPPTPDRGAVHRLLRLAAPLPPRHRAPVLTCAAMIAWSDGNGALARVCVEDARAADATLRLAVLVEGLLDAGVDPRVLMSGRKDGVA